MCVRTASVWGRGLRACEGQGRLTGKNIYTPGGVGRFSGETGREGWRDERTGEGAGQGCWLGGWRLRGGGGGGRVARIELIWFIPAEEPRSSRERQHSSTSSKNSRDIVEWMRATAIMPLTLKENSTPRFAGTWYHQGLSVSLRWSA